MLVPVVIGTFLLSTSYTTTSEPLLVPAQEAEASVSEKTEDVMANPTTTEATREEVKAPEVKITKPVVTQVDGTIIYTQDNVRLVTGLVTICKCESGGRQFKADGTVIRGIVNSQDIGMCQINLKYHQAAADRMGLDLFTEEGNITYANHLYASQGAQPWGWSSHCHGQK